MTFACVSLGVRLCLYYCCTSVSLARAKGVTRVPAAFDISIGRARARDLDAARMPSELLARGSIHPPRESAPYVGDPIERLSSANFSTRDDACDYVRGDDEGSSLDRVSGRSPSARTHVCAERHSLALVRD